MPFSFAFAGGCVVLAGFLRGAALPAGLAAGLWLQLTWAGDFGPHLEDGGPALATWVALVGAALAIPAGIVIQRRWGSIERRGLYAGLAALLFVLPVAVHGMREWEKPTGPRVPLTPGLRRGAGRAPGGHGRLLRPRDELPDSGAGAGLRRRRAAGARRGHGGQPSLRTPAGRHAVPPTGDLEIPRRYGANWLVVDRQRSFLRPALPLLHADDRYLLYRL